MNMAEPSLDALRNPVKRYLLATRPAFLSIAVAGCLLGIATAAEAGFSWQLALLTTVLALATQAGVNVFNDYYDHLNGTDALNVDRLYPFTGGSRFIQNGVISPRKMRAFALALFALVGVGGLWLITHTGIGLLWIGLSGMLVGWAYSAPPLRLNSRGLGELGVAVGFLLIVAGADYVQRGEFAALPWLAGIPYALLVTNILYINQFPDRSADRQTGKMHWVARLNPQDAAKGYWVILGAAAGSLVWLVAEDHLPPLALLSALALLPGLLAGRLLAANASQPSALASAIQMTIFTAHAQTLLLAVLLWLTLAVGAG